MTEEQRPAFLDEACGGDGDLHAEVKSLIAASRQEAWIDQPLAGKETVTLEGLPAPLAEGQRIAHYQVVRKLGEGGMGVVYKAIDANLDRPVALKVLQSDRRTILSKQRFMREAKAASALNHPNIVTVYEFGSDDGLDFIAMEYVEGSTLHELLNLRGTPRETMLEYARQAAVAVAKAHAAGIVHRDLKPNNIMATREGLVKVLDFGLAKQEPAANSDATQTLSLTIAGAIAGTPAYMSPEQAAGEPADHRSDIFSLGVILYEIVCGERPFRGPNPQATLHQIATAEPPPVEGIDPSAPKQLVALIERCLTKNREQRLQSMNEVAAGLSAILQPQPAPSRRPVAAGILTIGILGALGMGTGIWFRRQAAPIDAARSLNCSLLAQRMDRGSPLGDPYVASPADTFQGGWRFRLQAESPQSGFLYIINDGPDETGRDRLFVLYPPAGAAPAPLPANQGAETGWYDFDRNPGTEKLWIVWAEQPVEVLGTAGRVDNPDLEHKIRDILAGLKPGKAVSGTPNIRLQGADAVLGGLLELRHR
jgi:predicted Ser/Thr protein kinase